MALINPASSLSWTKLTQNPEWRYRHSRRQNQQYRIHISSKVRRLQAQGSSHWSVHVALGRVLMGAVYRQIRKSRPEKGGEGTAGARPLRAEWILEKRHKNWQRQMRV